MQNSKNVQNNFPYGIYYNKIVNDINFWIVLFKNQVVSVLNVNLYLNFHFLVKFLVVGRFKMTYKNK